VLALRDGPGHDRALLGYMAGLLAEHRRGGETAKLAALLEGCGARALQQLFASPPAHQDAGLSRLAQPAALHASGKAKPRKPACPSPVREPLVLRQPSIDG